VWLMDNSQGQTTWQMWHVTHRFGHRQALTPLPRGWGRLKHQVNIFIVLLLCSFATDFLLYCVCNFFLFYYN
jgi:hypothetical protein